MKHQTLFLWIGILMAINLLGCANTPSGLELKRKEKPQNVRLWPQSILAPKAGTDTETTQPDMGDNVIRLTHVTDPSMQVFPPARLISPGPAVLVCPGGSYTKLSMNKEGTEIAEWLNSLGVTAIVLKYRVPNQRENAFGDIQRAMRIIRSRADEWKIDPNRIGVMGFSAGGHLAARLSGDFRGTAYEPLDEIDAVSCRPDFFILVYPAYLVDKENRLNPEITVSAENPPVFLVQTQDDRIPVENSVYYFIAAKQAGISCELHVFPRGGHGYGMRPSPDAVSQWPTLCEKWLRHQGILNSPSSP